MTDTKKMRSPNFPAFTLQKCLELARVLFDKYRLTPVAYEVVMKGLNYSPKSSGALQLTAALSAYGLIEIVGHGREKRIKLSQLAYQIIEDKRNISYERDDAIREAALRPDIFKKIKEDFPEYLPAEDVLEHDLKFKYAFNPKAVPNFITTFISTMQFAEIYKSDIVSEEKGTSKEKESIMEGDKQTIKPFTGFALGPKPTPIAPLVIESGEREIANYPIRGGTIRLLASGPVTQKAIDKLIALLRLSKEDFPEDDQPITGDSDMNKIDKDE